MIEKTAARANVGIDEARVQRILPPVRQLVAIGVEDRVETKRLDSGLLTLSCNLANSRQSDEKSSRLIERERDE
jgi:hypothetical protein